MLHRLRLFDATIVLKPTGGDEPDRDNADAGQYYEGSIANRRVLIVEDEGLVAMGMERALAEAGFDVIEIVDTESDAVDAAGRLQPDVILVDVKLREGDGISAAIAIQKLFKTVIVFVSGNSDSATLARAKGANPAGFIRKPFIAEQFGKLVEDALRAKN